MKVEKIHIENFTYFYFIGIGGIGMSALARFFKAKGKSVSGYDRTQTALTSELQTEGMIVHYEENISLIPSVVFDSANKEKVLIVYSPAVPRSHSEYQYFEKNGFCIRKRSEVLGMLTENTFTIAVAGTHGKTTITSMITHFLRNSGIDCTSFVGGITINYESNLVLSEKSDTIVVEADEYDRSFLALHPDIAVVSSVDPDHLDIYNNKAEIENTYRQFVSQIKKGGTLIYNKEQASQLLENNSISAHKHSYSLADAEWKASNISFYDDHSLFDISGPSFTLNGMKLGIPGKHNVENALAAFIVAKQMGATDEKLRIALSGYKGVKRRFEYHVKTDQLVYIDDYAHHPREIQAFIQSVKNIYPNKKITGIFQPHLFSRTRDFIDQFAESLSLLDELILLEIYPAREEPILGINSTLLLNRVKLKNKKLCTKEEAVALVSIKEDEVVLTIGAGDIDLLINPIKNALQIKLKDKLKTV